jgi:hypothetical protein
MVRDVSTALDPHSSNSFPPLFARLVDDGAVFPPARVPMGEATRAHLAARVGAGSGLTGVFLCPASRLPELITELVRVKPAGPVEVSLVVDNGLGGLPKAVSTVEGRRNLLTLRMVEMAAPTDVDAVWLERVNEFVPEDVVRVVEPRRPQAARGSGGTDAGAEASSEWLDGVRRVAAYGCWPKLRCGGLAVPGVTEVVDFLTAVTAAGTPFKATAGLHRALRGPSRDGGADRHGFLNLLVAVARVQSGGDVTTALTSTDAAGLIAELGRLTAQGVQRVRTTFTSFASSSPAAPLADLERLGLL